VLFAKYIPSADVSRSMVRELEQMAEGIQATLALSKEKNA
jgi:hypothetical protein